MEGKRDLQESIHNTCLPPGYRLVTYRILPAKFQEIEPPGKISIPEQLETIARRVTSDLRADRVDFSFEKIAQQTLKHDIALTLSHIDNERQLSKQLDSQMHNTEFQLELELERVRKNRAYTGFGYSDTITNRLLAIEREHRASHGIHQDKMQQLHDRLWQQLKQLLSQLSYNETKY